MKTAEFVTPKHPDKMCDQISDGIVDLALAIDPNARVAAEVMGGHGSVYVTGEITMENMPDAESLHEQIKQLVEDVTDDESLEVSTNISRQSPEIAQGVDTGGAGDQGIMRGYAIRDTVNLMPLEYDLARSLCRYLYRFFPHDGKTQVTVNDAGEVATIVVSFQNATRAELVKEIMRRIEENNVAVSTDLVIHANPAGDWDRGGFEADTGLTGRKLAVDNYGPRFPIGGGAFSGKDATKVDRSAAYMARRIAVDLLKLYPDARQSAVELAYAIGVAQPVEVSVLVQQKDGPWTVPAIDKYDLTPKGIIDFLDLRKPQYRETAKWGHFGANFKWDV